MKNRFFKIIFAICIFGSAVVLPTSCEKSAMLDTEVYGQLTPDSFYKTEADLKASLVGLMIYVSGRGVGTDYGLWTSHIVTARMLGLCMSDEVYSGAYSAWTFNPASGNVNNGPGRPEGNWAVWLFNRIAGKCTAAIHDMENSPIAKTNPDLVADYVKQLKGLRALYMYTCYQFFGPVNTSLTYEETISTTVKARMTDAEFTAQIESDLAAVFDSKLPDKQTGANRGYVSKDFFRMLGIRYYMNTGQWAKSEVLCRYLKNSGNYSLITTPGATVAYTGVNGTAKTWTYSPYEVAVNTCPNSETIFSLPADKNHGNIWITEATRSGQASEGPGEGRTLSGWGVFYTQWNTIHQYYGYYANSDKTHTVTDDSWANDNRTRAWWVSQYRPVTDPATGQRVMKIYNENPDVTKGESTLTGAIPVKFTNWFTSSYVEFEIEQPAYRLSDVYLYLAECIVRQKGVTQEAIDLVADIRARAGLGRDLTKNLTPRQISENPIPTSNPNSFLMFILWERGRELFGEGQRYEDLKRFGMLTVRAKERNLIADPVAAKFRNYIALPTDIVLQGKGVVLQNPGYDNPWGTSYPSSELKSHIDN